jgi:hypothetical protein
MPLTTTDSAADQQEAPGQFADLVIASDGMGR